MDNSEYTFIFYFQMNGLLVLYNNSSWLLFGFFVPRNECDSLLQDLSLYLFVLSYSSFWEFVTLAPWSMS